MSRIHIDTWFGVWAVSIGRMGWRSTPGHRYYQKRLRPKAKRGSRKFGRR